MTALLPRTPAKPPLTGMSAELGSLRASVNKLARAQNALVFVKALTDQVQSLSGAIKAMRPGAAEEEASRPGRHSPRQHPRQRCRAPLTPCSTFGKSPPQATARRSAPT
jgi:hypothetical protein